MQRGPRFRALEDLPRNARNSILMEPLWGIFATPLLYYAPLYMSSAGLSSTQIGLLGSLFLALSFVFQALAGPVTNRFGRKRTTLWADLISWTLPMLVWAVAQSFAAFAVAAALNATNRIAGVSWSLLTIEDVRPGDRPRVFGILNLIVTTCGLLTPLVGLVIARQGITPTLRGLYFAGAIGMTVMFVWRNRITSETLSGVVARARHKELGVMQSLRHSLAEVAGMRRHPGLLGITAFYVLTIFLEQLSLFQILFLERSLRFSAQSLSYVPVAGVVVTGLLYTLVLPRLARLPVGRTLVLTRALGLIGAVALLLVPAGHLSVMLLVVSLLGGATFLTQTYREAALFARLPTAGAANLYSAVQTLALLCSVPAAALAGAVFAAAPRGLFVLIAAVCALLLGLAVWLAGRETVRPTPA